MFGDSIAIEHSSTTLAALYLLSLLLILLWIVVLILVLLFHLLLKHRQEIPLRLYRNLFNLVHILAHIFIWKIARRNILLSFFGGSFTGRTRRFRRWNVLIAIALVIYRWSWFRLDISILLLLLVFAWGLFWFIVGCRVVLGNLLYFFHRGLQFLTTHAF